MNIYDFFKSPDIAAHCKKIGHEFNSLEMAVIVDISGKPLKDKFAAWREIAVGQRGAEHRRFPAVAADIDLDFAPIDLHDLTRLESQRDEPLRNNVREVVSKMCEKYG